MAITGNITPPFSLQIQNFDGVAMAFCQELGVITFGRNPDEVKRKVFNAIIANARVVSRKVDAQLVSDEERLTSKHAKEILEHQANLSCLFRLVDLNIVQP